MDILWRRILLSFIILHLVLYHSTVANFNFVNQNITLNSEGKRILSTKVETTELQGDLSKYMYYYVDVYVGSFNSVPSKQSLIIDTGSTITMFPCQGYCKNWGDHMNQYFPLDESMTKQIINYDGSKCKTSDDANRWIFSQYYKEGSKYQGFYVSDTMVFDKDNANPNSTVIFGCVSEETGLFKSQFADGIMGLAAGSHERHFPSVNQQLYQEGVVDSPTFSLWLGKEGGSIMFGGYDENIKGFEDDTIQWFPLMNENSYTIELDKFYVGNVHIPHVPRVGLIDSGSSWLITSFEESEHIDQAFEQYCSQDTEWRCIGKKIKHESKCYEYDTTKNTSLRSFFKSFPTITFTTISGGELHWYPSEYFEKRIGTSIFCAQIHPMKGVRETVLGASFLRQTQVIMDINTNQVGFRKARCSEDQDRVTTSTFNSSIDFLIEECHMCDVIQEEVNVILFVAVGLLVCMLFAIAVLVGSYFIKDIRIRRSSKIGYTSYSEDVNELSNDSTEMDHVGIINHVDEDDF